ncbi:unnamed protein product [Ostreobium quekettii]|uniref:RWP-RK domain-containing protein n=1 Tax=Ostreobium quekettii TaxID=121088 RepID=A0A8S1J176_9CHLO|nr:unnamed protein product [Ostreobium quekettii]
MLLLCLSEASKEARVENNKLPAYSSLGLSGSAPNLTTLTGHLDPSRSTGDGSTSVSPVSGVVPGVQYPFPTFLSSTAGPPICYPNSTQHPGMNYMAVANMQGNVPMVPQFDVNASQVPMVPQVAVPMNPSTFNPVNRSQDMANAMMHIQNFQSLLQELQPGSRRARNDSRKSKTNMGTGRHLTFEDLKRHMNVGLKEAAAQLGICPTTLKRACRRNGITRWPCRQLAKLNKTMSDLGHRGPPPDNVLASAFRGQLKTSSLTRELSSAELSATGEKDAATTQGVDIQQQAHREIPGGPSSAPACLDLLAESEGQLLGSSSSHGFLSTVLGEQDYEWATTGDDGDDYLRAEDDNEAGPSNASGQSGGALASSSTHETKVPVPLQATSSAATGGVASTAGASEQHGVVQHGSASFGSVDVTGSDAQQPSNMPEGGLSLADFLRESFDVNELDRLDIDSDMPDLGEMGQAS